MAKFTLILEFRGGTYIRQLRAASPKAALSALAAGPDPKSKLFGALLDDKPVAIDGVTNCWCSSAVYQGKLALVNIVRTV